MKRKIHMHDQVFNKVEDIMNHYKRNPIDGLMRILKQFMKQSSMIWCHEEELSKSKKYPCRRFADSQIRRFADSQINK